MKRSCFVIVVGVLLWSLAACGARNHAPTPTLYTYGGMMCSLGRQPTMREGDTFWGISILDYPKEWHVEQPQKHVVIPVYDVPKAQRGYAVKLPQTYCAEADGIYFEVNFFEETYEYNDLIQVRIKMTNRLGHDLEYHSAHKKTRFENESNGYTVYPSHYRDKDCLEHTTDPDILVLSDGESVEFEEILVCDPHVFVPGDAISCIITPQLFEKMYEPGVVIPVEIACVE